VIWASVKAGGYHQRPSKAHEGRLTDETSRTADKTKTGSAAASKKSYFAIKAKKGIINNGTIIIRLMTATKTVLFSPGYAADLGLESADVETPFSFEGGAEGV
jgi:hypothetical protein